MIELKLLEARHPNQDAITRFASLIGIDHHKDALLEELILLFDPERIAQWTKTHHGGNLFMAESLYGRTPLVILSGDVGCGKTALASSIGTPLAEKLDRRVIVLETPSDIRGTGLVGELSARITSTFSQAKSRIGDGVGLLIIDEGDDLGTSRSQSQAHHEDRAGLNVLIKQIDLLQKCAKMAVILITNRFGSLDPALVRRASLHISFARPNRKQRELFFERILGGIDFSPTDLEKLIVASDRTSNLFTYSDLMHRVGGQALRNALRENEPLSVGHLLEALNAVAPSPALDRKDLEGE